MKELPIIIGKEYVFSIDYGIARFLESKNAWRTTKELAKNNLISFKPILEQNLAPQMQIHIRFYGSDTLGMNNDTLRDEVLDIDVYIQLTEFMSIIQTSLNNYSLNI